MVLGRGVSLIGPSVPGHIIPIASLTVNPIPYFFEGAFSTPPTTASTIELDAKISTATWTSTSYSLPMISA
jgi:hypothetical protein